MTIKASRTEVDPEQLAGRLGEVLGREQSQVREALGETTVILQKGLSYRDATEVQRELGRRKIPSQVTPHDELTGQEVALGKVAPSQESEIGERDPAPQFGAEPADEQKNPDERGEEQDTAEPPSEGKPTGSGAWTELFPDLEQDEEVAEVVDDEDQTGQPPSEPQGQQPVDPLFSEGFAELEKELNEVGHPEEVAADPETGELPAAEGGRHPGGGGVDGSLSEPGQPEESGGFDPGKISEAFSGDDQRPPYKPKGYDNRTEHLPLVASFLSLIAPGAGQVYNGQPDKGRRYGWMFIFIVPWVQAVRQAWVYGEKVRTYYAPRPEEGTGKKALMYGATWWLVVLIFALVGSTTFSAIMEYQQAQQERQEALMVQQLQHATQERVEIAVEQAVRIVDEKGEDIVAEAAEASGEYTMDDEERARRLFILGYHYCKGGEYQMCDEMMGRVTSLEPANRDAYQIQTWASLRAQGVGEGREMPEVDGVVPTLQDFEIELAAKGEELEDVDEQFDSWWNVEGEEAVAQGEEEEEESGGPTLEQLGEELEVGE